MKRKVEIEKLYSLSPMQEGMLYHSLLNKDSTAYFELSVFSISGDVDREILQKSLNLLIEKHESLRTVFVHQKVAKPKQVVLKNVEGKIDFEDISYLNQNEQEKLIQEYQEQDRDRGFDLTKHLLMRIALFKIDKESYKLIWSFPHIIMDGWCLGIIFKDLMEIYSTLKKEETVELASVTPYIDYIKWLEKQNQKAGLAFWEDYLTGYDAQATLPKLGSPVSDHYQLEEYHFMINEEFTIALMKIAQENQVTVNTIIQTAWGVLLQKYNNTDDVVFGAVVSGRPSDIAGIAEIVGLFINTVPVRVSVGENRNFSELLKDVQLKSLSAKDYEYLPLADIQASSSLKNNLLDHLMVFENYPIEEGIKDVSRVDDLGFRVEDVEFYEQTNYDFNLLIYPEKELSIKFSFNGLIYESDFVKTLATHFTKVLNQVVENPEIHLNEIEIISEKEKEFILSNFNATEGEDPADLTIHGLFEEGVKKTPDQVAVVFQEQQITYKELNARANQLASFLRKRGVNRDQVVGLMMERSIEMIIGLLGILKAGGAYLPIDFDYPESRKKLMLDESGVNFILTNFSLEPGMEFINEDIEIVNVHHVLLESEELQGDNLVNVNQGSDLVYTIFTSGSTGKPKGVMIEHRNVVNLLNHQYTQTNIDFSKVLQFTTISFDVSFQEIFSTLVAGGRLYLMNKETRNNIPELFSLVRENEIKTLFLPASFLKFILNEEEYVELLPDCIDHIITAGEQLLVTERFRSFLKKNHVYLHNHYGPSETHVVTTLTIDPKGEIADLPSIGKPILNTKIYMVDKDMHLQPVGVAGELYIGGSQVGRGYYGREDLTAEKFITDLFDEGDRLYRTGDSARWQQDGTIEFLGRIDHQVKIRGFRVELGEIESQLLEITSMKEAVVIDREDRTGEKILVAYIVSNEELDQVELRDILASKLPNYMIPSYFVELDKIPLTPNGKVDRKALPEVDVASKKEYIAPRNEIETKLTEIWSEVLKIDADQISIDDNFFELGGHSLKAIQIISKVKKELNVDITIPILFESPMIGALASLISDAEKTDFVEIEKIEKKDFYELSYNQKRLWFVNQLDPESPAYNLSGKIELKDAVDQEIVKKALYKILERHESFRTGFKVINGEPVQFVRETVELPFEFIDLSMLYEDEKEIKGQEILARITKTNFDLSIAPLFKVALVKLAENEYDLIYNMHHIISDGWSMQILKNEFLYFYEGYKDHQEVQLEPVRYQYKDVAAWQNKQLSNPLVGEKSHSYWENKLKEGFPRLELPRDFALCSNFENPKGSSYRGVVTSKVKDSLKKLAKDHHTSLFMVMFSAANLLLARLTNQKEIVMGIAGAGREHISMQNIIGYFINSILVKNNVEYDEKFTDLLQRIDQGTLEAFQHQSYPIELALNDLKMRSPEVSVFFNMLNMLETATEEDLHSFMGQHLEQVQDVKFDLELYVIEYKNGIEVYMHYKKALFLPETIEYLANEYLKILSEIASEPMNQVKEYDFFNPSFTKMENSLQPINGFIEFKKEEIDQSIVSCFEKQVELYPKRIAVQTESRSMTYQELNEISNQIAHSICGITDPKPEGIALLFEHEADMITGIFGTLKSANYYIPLDPTYPVHRLVYMLQDSKVNVLLTNEKNKSFAESLIAELDREIQLVNLNEIDPALPKENLHLSIDSDHISYILHTSGSTGKPKGVIQKQKNVLHFIQVYTNNLHICSEDRLTLLSSYSFDAAVMDIYGALLNGATLYPYDLKKAGDLSHLSKWLRDEKITIYHSIPTVYRYFTDQLTSDEEFTDLRLIVLGGEPVYRRDVERYKKYFKDDCLFVNGLGPTESTVTLQYFINKETKVLKEAVPVGFPVDETEVFLIDENNEEARVFGIGEIVYKSDYLALGYLNNPEKTAEVFVDDPLSYKGRVYRSGDLGRRLIDGSIEFIGRGDAQVKIRGYRIELGEVENWLITHPDIQGAVVVAKEDGNGNKYLCGYYLSEEEVQASELREFLAKELPDYMIPSYYVKMNQFPVTQSGKINRRVLPEPDFTVIGVEYIAPRDQIEETLAQIWADVLSIEVEKIGAYSNFFEIGGHSLKATQLISKIYKEFDVKVPLTEVFKKSTVSDLAEYIKGAVKENYQAIEVATEKEYYSLSSAQKRLYILQKLETGYSIPTVALLEGEVEIEKLKTIFKKLLTRHESLRTSFEMVEGQAVQRINDPDLDFNIEYFESTKEDVAEIIKSFIRPFDLEQAPLFRAGLIKVGKDEHLLIIDMHHIISDGTSLGIFVKDFMSLYSGEELPELRIQYKDVAEWQQTERGTALLKEQEEYWLNEFAGQIPVLNLPVDYQRPIVQSFEGNRIRFELGIQETEELNSLAQNENATLYMVLLTIYNVFLSKLSGQEDIIVGTPIAGRRHADLENIIGVFINTLVLRNQPVADLKIKDFIREVRDKTLKALENQEYQFEELVQKVNVERDVSRTPLFDAFFALQNMDMPEVEIPSLKLKPYDYENKVSKFDLSFYGVEIDDLDGNRIRFTVEYSTMLFKEETIQRFISYFKKIVTAVLKKSEQKLSDIDILSASEKNQILYEFNDTSLEYSKDKPVHQLFEEQVVKTPDLKAIVYDDEYLTYQELNQKANQLANLLRSKGVVSDCLVGIMVTRSIEMMVGILGILKAGGAYLPIDPSYPDERIKYMLEDSQTAILLTEKELLGQLDHIQFAGEIIDVTDEVIESLSPENVDPITSPDHLAYVIYTSGSTGKPKGVMIKHRNVVNFITAIRSKIEFAVEKKILALTTISFDIFVLETWVPLTSGLTMVIADENDQSDLSLLKNKIIGERVDMLQVTPSRLTLLMESNDLTWLKGIEALMVGGEAFPDRLLKKVQSQFSGQIYNLYGPTETTVWSVVKDLTEAEMVTLGTPIANTQIYILNQAGQLQPLGVAGLLCIGGDGVTQGYLNNPELTAEKFINNPYQMSERVYRTGDLARWLPNGEIEFLGRIDHQVKIRGYRIELGEIESKLLAHDEIMEAVVIAVQTQKAVTSLAAYIVSKKELTVTDLRGYLSEELPVYMIPAYFVQIDEMPLTPNGKIDRKQLPEPEVLRPKLGTTFVAPKNNLEKQIAEVWTKVLKVDEVGMDDNFFDLGGNSFDLIQANTELNEVIEQDVPVVTMFRYPTIRSLAEYLDTHGGDQDTKSSHSDQYNRKEAIKEGKDRLRELNRQSRMNEENLDGKTGFEIAVVGLAGRFPGAKNVDEFWANLKDGVESITFFTDEELEEEGIDHELIQNTNYIKAKGVLEDIEYFDPLFFDYSPREVEMMDPQFRLFHECAWKALENAGYNPEVYPGLIGVYAGSSPNHSWMARAYSRIQSPADQYVVATLNGRDFLSTRIAYKLNLKGPGFTVQTACSTSLVAIDLACQNLLSGKCDMALAGGVSLSLPKKAGYLYQEGMIKSPDGHCRAFDAEAKGTIFGDGVGLVVLKRLDDALQDGDYIHAVIKGSAINNDGVRKVGFTAPSVEGQAEVIKAAQDMAEVEAESISYIETHGTATTLGDPIEVEALKLAFDTEKRSYCGIGSVKTNVGHLNIAAGVAGFIKTVLALEHKFIPPSLHFKSPNPKIDFENSPFYVNAELQEWKNDQYPLRAGVSSFGIGGTNAHIVLEEAPKIKDSIEARPYKLVMLSTKTASTLDRATENLLDYLRENPETNLADVAYTLQVGRKSFKYRRMIVAQDVSDLIEGLSALDSKKVLTSSSGKNQRPVIFMFSGQGSQYVNMGLELYQTESVFRDTVDQCFAILQPLINEDLKEILYPENLDTVKDKINQTYLTQPLIFTFEYALATLLLRWSVKPHAMIGHSIGEYVAACLSGVFSLQDALTLVTLRGRLMQEMPHGSMLSVPVSLEELEPLLPEQVSIAAVNTPVSTVLSGTDEVIDQCAIILEEKGYPSRRLHTSHAFHSMMMEPILGRFREQVQEMTLHQPEIPYISNVSGTWITVEEAMDPDYWVQHLRGTVRFADGMKELFKEEDGVFIEVGPGQTLSTFARQHPDQTRQHLILNLVRHPNEIESDLYFLLNKIGRLWLNGIALNWSEFYAEEERYRIPLPTYPFERLYFDIDITGQSIISSKEVSDKCAAASLEPTLYSRTELPDDYVAPRNEVEEKVVDVFGEVLGMDQISIHEDFFELGGDSLKSVSVAAKIHKELNVEIPLSEFFKRPTAAELAEYIEDAVEDIHISIELVEQKEYYRLSSAQKRLYLLQQMNPETLSYNMPFVNVLIGVLDQKRLEEIFKQLIVRHESLRTSFIIVDGEPVQKVNEKIEFAIEQFEANEEKAKEIINRFIRPFDFKIAPLLRVGLIRISEERHILMVDMHHIISDGTSQGIFIKEFMSLYEGDELSELNLQYKDYSEWQNTQYKNGAMEKQEKYWLNEFAGDIPKLNLLTDYPRPEVSSFKGDHISFELDQKDSERLKELIFEEKTTLFITLLAIYNVFLAKLTGDEEIVIGTVTDGRQHYDLMPIIGMFVNTLAMKNVPAQEKTFTEFLREVTDRTLQAFENQDYQFEDLVKKVVVNRESDRHPIFDAMFILQNMEIPEIKIPGLKLQPYEQESMISRFDLTLYAVETANSITCVFVYSTELFKEETIELMKERFIVLLKSVLDHRDWKIQDLEYRTSLEQELSDVGDLEFDF